MGVLGRGTLISVNVGLVVRFNVIAFGNGVIRFGSSFVGLIRIYLLSIEKELIVIESSARKINEKMKRFQLSS